jgi:hypothetical protein
MSSFQQKQGLLTSGFKPPLGGLGAKKLEELRSFGKKRGCPF